MPVAALLLTGGASRRFGAPKADVRVGGERLVDRTARVLALVAETVLEVGPGRSPLESVLEAEPGAGPLAAIAAGGAALAARGCVAHDVLVAAVDLPFLDPALLQLLAAVGPADAVVPRVDDRPQPLCARYSAEALARATELVAVGERSMQALLRALDVRWVDESEWATVTTDRAFVDVDTPDDARRIGLEGPG